MSRDVKKRINLAVATLSIPLFLVIWELVSRSQIVNAVLFPAPSTVAVAIYDWIQSGQFTIDFAVSLYRVVLGYLLGAFAGVVVGLLTGEFEFISSLLSPIFHVLRPIPPIAFVPVVILWFGLSESGKLFLI